MGPQLLSAEAPKKKKRKLPYEKLYISALPKSTRYSKSLMHKEQLLFSTVAPITDFVITSSLDGAVKFWKKMGEGIEFVKEYKAHSGEIRSVTVSADGRSFATAGVDKTIKLFDVITFDLLSMIQLEFTPKCICYVHRKGASMPLLAVSDEVNHVIRIYGDDSTVIHTFSGGHR